MPELLKKENRIIYLDVDILVKQDLDQLFETLDDKYLISGVKAAAYYYPQKNLMKRAEILGIDAFDQYVNAGVLVMNLALMREENLQEQFMALIDKNFGGQDQDIINSACYGKIIILPPQYNAMTKYNLQITDSYHNLPCLELVYSKQEWEEACTNPVIIHYADKLKPWEDFGSDYAEEWWNCAKDTGIHEKAFKKFLPIIAEKSRTKKYENLQEVKSLKNKSEEYRIKQNEYRQALLNEQKKTETLKCEIKDKNNEIIRLDKRIKFLEEWQIDTVKESKELKLANEQTAKKLDTAVKENKELKLANEQIVKKLDTAVKKNEELKLVNEQTMKKLDAAVKENEELKVFNKQTLKKLDDAIAENKSLKVQNEQIAKKVDDVVKENEFYKKNSIMSKRVGRLEQEE